MRQFWGNQLDFNDRNDFPAGNRFTGAAANPRPATTGRRRSRSATSTTPGRDITALGHAARAGHATAAGCTGSRSPSRRSSASGPTRRRAARATPSSAASSARSRTARRATTSPSLIKELFASPLVTGAVATGTYPANGSVPISISRRDHFCAALSNRLGKPDLCAQAVPVPSPTQTATRDHRAERGRRRVQPRLADPGHAVRSDAVLPLGQRAAVLEHRGAGRRPDGGRRRLLDERRRRARSANMVETLMGYPPGHPAHAEAIQILQEHYDGARTTTSGHGRRRHDDQRDERAALDVHPGLRVTNRRRDRPLKGEPPMTRITRREGLLAGLFGTGYIGLRALATGLPAWYLLNPSRATAQDLQCAITAQRQPAVPDRQHVEQRRSAQLQLPGHVRGATRSRSSTRPIRRWRR